MICIFTKMPPEVAVALVKRIYLEPLRIVNVIDQTSKGDRSKLRRMTIAPLDEYHYVPKPFNGDLASMHCSGSDDFNRQATQIMGSVISNLYADRSFDPSGAEEDNLKDWRATYKG